MSNENQTVTALPKVNGHASKMKVGREFVVVEGNGDVLRSLGAVHACLSCEGCVPADGRQAPEAHHDGAGRGIGQVPAPFRGRGPGVA